ncbi:hypothetical protein [Bradyrhizobium sp. SZCCHNS3051]|uniref:hypothetical protein n=1 Tax=Bradyrhizobium sp. SZCCHNS3051 TaxID=3057320 RepID=UPI0029165996|nr:hypothetical protein [Bradyrhizobium sp. SZCCHNS3051]
MIGALDLAGGLTFSHGCNDEGVLANLILTADFVKRMYEESKKAGNPNNVPIALPAWIPFLLTCHRSFIQQHLESEWVLRRLALTLPLGLNPV